MERVRIGKDIVFQWEVRKDGAALTAEDAANLTLEIAGRNGKSQRLPFEIRDSKIIAAWYGVQQTEIGAYRLTCWHNRGKVGESVVDVVWAVELVRYTTEETFDDIETVTIELEGGNLTFAALKGASAYEVAVAEGFVGTEAEWIASLKKPAEDAAEDAEEAAARAIEAAENAEAASTRAETAAQSAENAAGNANTAAGLADTAAANAEAKAQLADTAAANAEAKAQLADTAADNANTAATEAYSKAQEADTAATTATNAAQSANMAATSANEAANSAVNAAVEATESAENAQTEAGNAHNAANYANEMAIAAERVNAQLNGNVLTITNRQGTSTSVNTKGEQGEQGNPGQAATISVGTTTTGAPGTSAQVINSGTSSAAVLDFTIPQGAKGDKGDQGEPGEVTEAELTEKLAAKANTDGYYSRMIVGGAESLIGDVPQTATYTYRRTGGGAIGEPVARLTEIQGNTGVVNQLVATISETREAAGLTFTNNNTSIHIEGTCSRTTRLRVQADNIPLPFISGHKYCISMGNVLPSNSAIDCGSGIVGEAGAKAFITNISSPSSASYFGISVTSGDIFDKEYYPAVFDLTLMYGAEYEPGTVEEFEQRIWRDHGKTLDEYVAYTQGNLINCKAVALESVGQNQWDEEWELGGIDNSTGQNVPNNSLQRSVNYIPIIPNTLYYIYRLDATSSARIFYYDSNKALISTLYNQNSTVITPPANCRYMRFIISTGYDLTTKTICINISDAALKGTYRPYKKESVNLNLTTLTGINPTTGVRETIFPNGAGGGEGWRSALRVVNGAVVAVVNTGRYGNAEIQALTSIDSTAPNESNIIRFNFSPTDKANGFKIACNLFEVKNSLVSSTSTVEAISGYQSSGTIYCAISASRFGTTDLNTSAKRLAALKSWLQNNTLAIEYQLAEPIIYTDIQYSDGTPFVLPKNFEVQNDGTERITHTEGEDSIAPVMSAIYGLNAVGFVQDAPKDYTSQATLDGLIAKISAITGTTITKTWDAANGKWVFS